MNALSVKRMAFALAAASTVAYVGCVLVMVTLPKDIAVRFFNSLLHGVDLSEIIRWDMPAWDMAMGVLATFILAWLFGATIAALYNITSRSK